MRARFVPAALAALLVLTVGGSAAAAGQSAKSSAGAYGVRVLVPDGAGGGAGAVVAPPESSATLDGYSYGDGAVSTGTIVTTGRAGSAETRASAAGRASLQSVSLFGGEITADAAVAKATARASATGAGGSLGASSLANLVVLGEGVDPAPNLRVKLGDWGYAVLLEQAVVRQQSRRHGFRGFVTALHVVLTKEHGGLPAGSEIMVGYAEAAAAAPKPPPPPPPPPPPEQQEDPDRPPREPVPEPLGPDPNPPPIVQDPPEDVRPQLTAGGYVFPVYGPASFTDDFAAARAITGWHHGNDLFAALGAPILAVTDGTLFLVGWNDVGGNRLWLRDDQGNEFYYAHLSAYAPAALEGARVRAGDVIGFVGATGDAVGTPPHLHFEIHPRDLLWLGYDGVVNPYTYLVAWRRLVDIAFGGWTPPAGEAPPAGAVLLQADDISALSGLGDGSLSAFLEVGSLFGEALPGPVIVGAEPGFGA